MEKERGVIIVGSGGKGLAKSVALACHGEQIIHLTESNPVINNDNINPIVIERAIRNEQKVLNPEGSKYIPTKKRKG